MEDHKIGSKVLVKNWGSTFSKYDKMFKKLNFKNTERNEGKYGADPHEIYEVFDSIKHPDYDIIMYALRDSSGREFLVGERSLIFITM